jgi:AraC family transcriptional regulator of adaptative response/methylated-DNA-[protein]-cysteine methyltransferase
MGLQMTSANDLSGEGFFPGSELDFDRLSEDYGRIEQAILFLERNVRRQPSLKEVAESVNLSEYHFQRLFTRWVGISPKRFLQFLTKEGAKRLLEKCENVLSAAYGVGLSGPGRLHDLFVSTEAVTPGEYKSRGEGLEIHYGFHPSPFGEVLLALTPRGLCHLAFVEGGGRPAALEGLWKHWQRAGLVENPAATRPLVGRIFAPPGLAFYSEGTAFPQEKKSFSPLGAGLPPLPVYLNGTNFQLKVWEALLRIPPGSAATYEDIARSIGLPKAVRAVGNAVGHNPLPVLIPCHRVLRKVGGFGGYRYGAARKKALLGWELARVGGFEGEE